MKNYNSVFTLAFKAQHEKQDASDLTYSDLRDALQDRLDRLDDTPPDVLGFWFFDGPDDTQENTTDED
tara:strand:+ start:30 stop:233 length:204 start_codon:yes stop_codon:yes gene_type:complete